MSLYNDIKKGEKLMNKKTAFERSKNKNYSKFSSWAVWDDDEKKISDTSVINENTVNPKFVFAALNPSADPGGTFQNFHSPLGNKHDKMIRNVIGKDELFAGAYLTDIVKRIEPNSKKVNVTDNDIDVFLEEIRYVCGEDCIIIAFGGKAYKAITKRGIKCYKITHFAYRFKDKNGKKNPDSMVDGLYKIKEELEK